MIQESTVTQARNTDLIAFLEQHNGLTFSEKGGEYRSREHPSLAVKADRLSWFWHSKGVGGYGVLDYLIKIEGYSFKQAIEKCGIMKAEFGMKTAEPTIPNSELHIPNSLVLPQKAFLYKRLFAYLCKTRGIDQHIVATLIHEKKLYEDTKGNIVFIGYDEQHQAKYATLRGTYTNNPFRMDCPGSDKRYSFNMAASTRTNRLYVYESPIDALSHATLENLTTGNKTAWQGENLLSLGGTSSLALDKYTELHPDIRELIFCLDSDTAGREAAASMARAYTAKGYTTRLELPENKDYNEDLLAYRATHQTIKRSVTYDR